MKPKIRLFSPSLLCSSFSRYRNVNSGRRFLYSLIKLSFQFSVVTTVAIALMLYDVYSEGFRPKLGCGTDCLGRAFSCFYSVPELTFRESTWLRSPVSSKFFPIYLSPITHHLRLSSLWWRGVIKQHTKI